MSSEMIVRNISYEDRVFDIFKSIREPYLFCHVHEAGVPTLKIEFGAKGGVCLYRYQHSGLIGMDSLKKRLKDELGLEC